MSELLKKNFEYVIDLLLLFSFYIVAQLGFYRVLKGLALFDGHNKKLFDRILKIWYGFAIHDACTDILFPCRIDWGYIDNKIVVFYFDDILKDSCSLFLIISKINEVYVMINDI